MPPIVQPSLDLSYSVLISILLLKAGLYLILASNLVLVTSPFLLMANSLLAFSF